MCDEKLERIRELNRARQSRFHALHKDAQNEKRRELYKLGRSSLKQIETPREEYVGNNVDLHNEKVLTYEEAVKSLEKVIEKKTTLNKYKQDLKRLILITECENLIQCFKSPREMIERIENGIKAKGEEYSINTKKSLYQTILFMISHFKLNIPEKHIKTFKNKFEEYKIMSSDQTKQNAETEIMTFTDYIEDVLNHFGQNSKMYILTLLYDELTLRDDFILKMINKKEEAVGNTNYIVIPKTGKLTLIINSYKTEAKYGVITHLISTKLSKMIRTYISTNNIENYLFGNKKLTSFVSLSNKEMGMKGGISEFRHMKITEELNSVKITPEERVKLAEKMKHSPATQLNYIRKLKE